MYVCVYKSQKTISSPVVMDNIKRGLTRELLPHIAAEQPGQFYSFNNMFWDAELGPSYLNTRLDLLRANESYLKV